ncbi:hypothetical protein [Nocardia arizonensis]|uniref:hypothetical protein n=1 Tax=Nocardia arizonensis TaxID=1141647 RepID=UPI0006D14B6F|nr:hypothetical protein [Nocardia arizonensis]
MTSDSALWIAAAVPLLGSAALVVARFRHDRVVLIWVPSAVAAALFPLGWSHQWIWLVPMLMWLRANPRDLQGPPHRAAGGHRRTAVPEARTQQQTKATANSAPVPRDTVHREQSRRDG